MIHSPVTVSSRTDVFIFFHPRAQLSEFSGINHRLEVERHEIVESHRAESALLLARVKKTDADLKHAQQRERQAAESNTAPVVPVPTYAEMRPRA